MKRRSIIAIVVVVLTSFLLIGMVKSCSREEIVYQEQPPQQEVVYVQSDNGEWLEYAMWYHIMSSSGRQINYNNYHYSTRSGNTYRPYKPTSNDFSAMKNKKYTGKTMVARPPVAMKQKTSMFGKKTIAKATPQDIQKNRTSNSMFKKKVATPKQTKPKVDLAKTPTKTMTPVKPTTAQKITPTKPKTTKTFSAPKPTKKSFSSSSRSRSRSRR